MIRATGREVKADLSIPIYRIRWTLAANEERQFTVADSATLYFLEGNAAATGGNVSIRFGETGDLWKLVRGLWIRTSGFRRFTLKENAGGTPTGVFLYSADPEFQVSLTDTGLATP